MGFIAEAASAAATALASVFSTAGPAAATTAAAAAPTATAAAAPSIAAGATAAGTSALGAATTAAQVATAGLALKSALSKPKTPQSPLAPTPPGLGLAGATKPAAELGGTSLVSSAFQPNTTGGKTLLGQ